MPTDSDSPDLSGFRELASDRRVIPVVRRRPAHGVTPVELYKALSGERGGTFLLESAEKGVWSRYSFVGARAQAMLTEHEGQAVWLGDPPAGVPVEGTPLDVLRAVLEVLHTEPFPGLPPLTGGMVGAIGYDAVRRLERLPELAHDDLQLPELAMLLATDLAVLDHELNEVLLIANAVNHDGTNERVDDAWAGAVERLDALDTKLATLIRNGGFVSPGDAQKTASPPIDETVETTALEALMEQAQRNQSAEYFQGLVERAREEIESGEAFQIVLSQRFSVPCQASAIEVYAELRRSNPSPYMYLIRFEGTPTRAAFDVVGSSPEALVTVKAGKAVMHPIAGSRPRGATADEDSALESELLADPKERAEHLMLVDLGRNDLGRVCVPGSVEVSEFMAIERFSHIMHIVSTVEGQVASGHDGLSVLTACFPAGTLSGAPKPRAMEIIEELEPTRRGIYGGVVGYLDFAGDVDTAIAIRTAVLQGGIAHVQAGAGLVADSDAAAEEAECRHKAAAALRAVAVASSRRQQESS
ncbi:MAG TPA: anthranilate synthase component I [Actinobacteria bacterium]|nr:anthranilate synthase component I [Actinomycetota bacterium]